MKSFVTKIGEDINEIISHFIWSPVNQKVSFLLKRSIDLVRNLRNSERVLIKLLWGEIEKIIGIDVQHQPDQDNHRKGDKSHAVING